MGLISISKEYIKFSLAPLLMLFCLCSFASDKFNSLIEAAALRHDIDPVIVKAVIFQESKFDETAVGKSGEIGLMQVKMAVVDDWSAAMNIPMPVKEEIFNPELNIEVGTWYLARAVKYWKGSAYKYALILGLCEYNAGRNKMKEWLPALKHKEVVIKIPSTKEYVSSIIAKYMEYTFMRFAFSPREGLSMFQSKVSAIE